MRFSKFVCILSVLLSTAMNAQENFTFTKPLYGAAYYSEYTPTDRLDEDIRLMKEAGLTDGKSVSKGQELTIGPWDVSIVVEK